MKNRTRMIMVALLWLPSLSFSADGKAVYQDVCMACHAAENVMVAAPKLADAAEWQRRLSRAARGIDTLTEHAVQGFGAMPPKGGRDSLTASEIRSAIAFMMKPKD